MCLIVTVRRLSAIIVTKVMVSACSWHTHTKKIIIMHTCKLYIFTRIDDYINCITLFTFPFISRRGHMTWAKYVQVSHVYTHTHTHRLFFFSSFFLLEMCQTSIVSGTLKGGRGCLMSPPCPESQGCHLIPLCYLLSCSSA